MSCSNTEFHLYCFKNPTTEISYWTMNSKGVREDDRMKTEEIDGEVTRISKCPAQLAEVRITDKSDLNIVERMREAKKTLDI